VKVECKQMDWKGCWKRRDHVIL